jgi:hypothetical protein
MDLIPGECNRCGWPLVKALDARNAAVKEMQHCMNGHTQTRAPTRAERRAPVAQSTSSFLAPYTTGKRSPIGRSSPIE